MYFTKSLFFVFMTLCLGVSIHAQSDFTLSPFGPIDYSVDCVEIDLNSTISFTTTAACGGETAITSDRGGQILFSTDRSDFDFTFDTEGEFTLFCNLSPTNIGSTTLCINIVDPIANIVGAAVPTTSEWGVIVLTLLLLILMTLAFEQSQIGIPMILKP